jgi:hypothetical protein
MTMKKLIELGEYYKGGARFTLPLDFVTRTLAIIGIRGSGKTTAATVLAEEMSECGLPWIALDPVGTFWGLRADKEGQPGGYPVLILGGGHGDLPITKNMGRSIAQAILEQNISCVIDLSQESKNTWRYFVTEFCDQLMELKPSVPRHIFLEETPEFCPQRPLGEQRRSLAAVDRLIRLGRNRGYGATLISQRFATINKDVLTQCENLLALRSIGKPDRKAVEQWIAECVDPSTKGGADVDFFLSSLTSLEDGVGWFWSPQWLNELEEIRIRQRKTYHPGETRTPGQIAKQVNISDLDQFVHKFKIVLDSIQKGTEEQGKRLEPRKIHMILDNPPLQSIMEKEIAQAQAKIHDLEEGNSRLTREVLELSKRRDLLISKVQKIREYFKGDYERLKELFDDDSDDMTLGSSIDASVYDVWKHKLGVGPGKIIDALISRDGSLTRIQIRTLTGQAERTFQNYLAKLHSNGLVKKDGKLIRLMVP